MNTEITAKAQSAIIKKIVGGKFSDTAVRTTKTGTKIQTSTPNVPALVAALTTSGYAIKETTDIGFGTTNIFI